MLQQRGLERGRGRVQLTRTRCVGPCGGAPLVVRYPQGDWYWGLRPHHAPQLVDAVTGGESAGLAAQRFRPQGDLPGQRVYLLKGLGQVHLDLALRGDAQQALGHPHAAQVLRGIVVRRIQAGEQLEGDDLQLVFEHPLGPGGRYLATQQPGPTQDAPSPEPRRPRHTPFHRAHDHPRGKQSLAPRITIQIRTVRISKIWQGRGCRKAQRGIRAHRVSRRA
ncbi:MAG TPA: (2Fe-2S) ferredoxin domain-containing protein [Chloroflexota bacterium]|nr:(2Fe-2S) ferredoxin domain-containing protein [Chloroflexota bacterium]